MATHTLTKDDIALINEALDALLDIDPSSQDSDRIAELMGIFKGNAAVLTTLEPV